MPLRKGQASESYKQGNLDAHNFKNDRKRASECGKKGIVKSHEARARNKKLRENLQALLELDVKNPKYIEAMQAIGVDSGDMTNQTLLMVALMKKGFSGDVAAIRQISDMMETLGIAEDRPDAGVVINVYPRAKRPDPEPQQDDSDVWDDEEDGWA